MADDLTLQVKAIVADAIKNLSEVQAKLGQVGTTAATAHAGAATAAAQHSSELRQLAAAGGSLGGVLEGLATRARNFVSQFVGLQALLAVGVGAFGLDALLKSTMSYDAELRTLTSQFGGNATAASTWAAVMKFTGQDVSQLEMGLKVLSKDMETNAAVFRTMNIATVDAHGNFLSVDQVLRESADYFHAHAGEAQNAALASALFGRTGYQLLPILEQGSAAIDTIRAAAQKYGLILDSEAIAKSNAFGNVVRETGFALQGLALNIGNALLPGIAALASGVSNLVETHMKDIISAVQSAVSWILGLVEAITGWNAKVDQSAIKLGEVTQAMSSYGAANQDATLANQGLTESISNQIQALQDKQRVAEEDINNQIQQLQLESQQENFLDQQTRLTQKKADDQKKIDKLRSDYGQALLIGDLAAAQTINDQLAAAQQTEADTELQIKRTADDQARQSKIKTLQDQMADERKATESQIKELQDKLKDATGSMRSAIIGAAGEIAPAFSAGAQQGADQMSFTINKAAEKMGADIGKQIKTGLDTGDWNGLGNRVGNAIGQGIVHGIVDALVGFVTGPLNAAWGKFLDAFKNADWGNLAPDKIWASATASFKREISGFAVGGTIPGPIGAPRLVLAHGGETVAPAGSISGRSRSGNVNVGPFYITGAGDPMASADAVAKVVKKTLRESFGYD